MSDETILKDETTTGAASPAATDSVHRARARGLMAQLLPVLRRRVRASGATLSEIETMLAWKRGYLSQLLRGTIYLKAHQLFALAAAARFDAADLTREVFGAGAAPTGAGPEEPGAEIEPAPISQARLQATLEELVLRWLEDERRRQAGQEPEAKRGAGDPALARRIRDRAQARASHLREHLRRTIFAQGVTLGELSAELGWGTGTIYTALSKRVKLTLRRLLEVLSGLGVDAGEFFADAFAREAEEIGTVETSKEAASDPAAALRSLLAPTLADLIRKHRDAHESEDDQQEGEEAEESPGDDREA